MKTEVVMINGKGDYLPQALDRIEGLANVATLSTKQSLYLRLLAEELFTLVRGITGDFDASFWAENDGNEFKVALLADVVEVSEEQKNELISLASNGKNSAHQGVMSKVGTIFEFLLKGFECYNLNSKVSSLQYAELGASKEDNKWSLAAYKANVTEDEALEELEKSIVANIADDIVVSVVDKKVKIEIFKKF